MRFYYRTSEDSDGFWTAVSEPVEAYGRGSTEREAIDELRRVLTGELGRPEAVAPPPDAPEVSIELLPVGSADHGARLSLDSQTEVGP
jgi:predicted RNase H-like HicB family nuclease